MQFGQKVNDSAFELENTQISNESQNLINRGRNLFNSGETLEEKYQSIAIFVSGLKKLNLLLLSEQDKQVKSILQQQYQSNCKEIEYMIFKLEEDKKGINSPIVIAQSGENEAIIYSKEQKYDFIEYDFIEMLQEDIITQKPNVKWDDIAGLVNPKQSLKEAVILPFKYPDIFKGARFPGNGVLLYGPPGTGKTFLAKACATEAETTFFSVSCKDLVIRYAEERERLIKKLFTRAREKKPSIIFFDEVDILNKSRDENENEVCRRLKTEFLVQMQGIRNISEGIVVMGSTNFPWDIDSAVRRRFEKRIYIPLPDLVARKFQLSNSLRNTPNTLEDEDFERLAQLTDGFSGADISTLVREAVLEPVRRLQLAKKFKKLPGDKFLPVGDNEVSNDIVNLNYLELNQEQLELPSVTNEDFLIAVKKVKPSVDQLSLKEFANWTQEFGQDG